MSNTLKGKAAEIWNNIKDLDVELFSIKGKKVNDYVEPTLISEKFLYVKLVTTATAILPYLDDLIGKKYDVSQEDAFIVVKEK